MVCRSDRLTSHEHTLVLTQLTPQEHPASCTRRCVSGCRGWHAQLRGNTSSTGYRGSLLRLRQSLILVQGSPRFEILRRRKICSERVPDRSGACTRRPGRGDYRMLSGHGHSFRLAPDQTTTKEERAPPLRLKSGWTSCRIKSGPFLTSQLR